MASRLIHAPLGKDVTQVSRELLSASEAGHINGLAVVIMFKGRRYMVDCCGEAARDPTFTRGCLASLDDCLRDILHRKLDSQTTM